MELTCECTVCVFWWLWTHCCKVSWPSALNYETLSSSIFKYQLVNLPQFEAWEASLIPFAQYTMFVHEFSDSFSQGLWDSEPQCLLSISLPESCSGIAVSDFFSLGLILFVFSWLRVIVEIWLYLFYILFESTPYKTMNHCTAPETSLQQKPCSSVCLPTHLCRTGRICHLYLSN